jgi:hypothetical protein
VDRTITVRLDRETRLTLARIAHRRRISVSDVVRAAIEAVVNREEAASSPYETIADLIGVVRGGDPERSTEGGRRFAAILQGRRRRS